MKSKILFFLVAFLSIHPGNIFSQIQITNYTNKNNINAVAVSGDNVWLATSGGIVHRKTDGTLVATYTVDEGLPNNYFVTIFTDSQGNIWCGSWNGVVKFDGSGMTIHNEVSSAELIYEDSQGNIWFARYWGGLIKYDGTTWTTYTTSDGLAYNYVYTIFEDSQGNFWFGYGYNSYGVTKFDGINWITYTDIDGLANNKVYTIEEDNSGNMWFGFKGYGSGVSKFDGTNWVNYTSSDFLLGDYIYDIHKDSGGNLWFGIYDAGINKYDGTTWSAFTQSDSLSSNYNYYIFEDSRGNLWFHGDYLDKFDGTQFTNYTTSNGLSGYDIYENMLAEDQTGNLWIGHGYNYKGLDKFDGSTFTNYIVDFEINSNSFYDILKDHNGNLWFAVSGADSLLKFDGTNWSYPGYHMGISTSYAYKIFEDKDNNLWFGYYELGKWDGNNWTYYDNTTRSGSQAIQAIAQDLSGNLWFGGTYNADGVNKFDGITWHTYTKADGLDTTYVEDILCDSKGNIWFTHNRYGTGVSKYDGSTFSVITPADGIYSNKVYSIFEDSQGNIWLGQNYAVSKFDGNNWTYFSYSEGFPGEYVYDIKEDMFGILWFATGYGLVKFDGTNWVHYTMESNGLLDNNLRVIEFDDNGNVWIGTYYGLSVATCEDPITDFNFSNTTIGDTTFLINFSSRVDALTRYEWDIGSDGIVESTDNHFKWKFDNPGTYIVELTAFNDNCSASVTKEVDVKEVVNSFPYNEDFESGRGYWTAHGINNSWEYGTPAGPTINNAYSNNAWVTNLSGDYNADEKSWVVGPPFDFSSLDYPVFEFKIWWDAEGFYDGANLQYKIGTGSWETAGALFGGQNWYNSPYLYSLEIGFGMQTENAIGWSGDGEWGYGSNDWLTARYGLFNLGNQSDVKLRIAFASNAEYQNDGFAFDDVNIFQSPTGIDSGAGLLSSLEIYPNPNKGFFYLDFNGENDIKLKLELINLQGQVVFNEETQLSNQFRKEFDVSYLPAGIYYLKMTHEDTVAVKKIVIE